MLFRKKPGYQVKANLLGSGGKLVVLDVSNSEGGIFRLVTVYAFAGSLGGWKLFYERLTFLMSVRD